MTAKIVYYGPGLCGKTTNLNIIYARTAQKARGEMVSLNTETDRTLFFDLLPLEVGMVGGFKAKLQLYTVPGQVFYNSTRKLVLKGVDGIVFVVDSQVPMLDANRESLQNLRNNLKELGLQLDDIPTVFQWNKRDLKNVVPVEVLEAELNPRGYPSYQTVAQEGEGVFETLRGITRLALAQIKALHLGETPSKDPQPVDLELEADPYPTPTPTPTPMPTADAVPEPVPEASFDDLFGPAGPFPGSTAASPAPEGPEALTASEMVMPDALGGEPATSGSDALSFLDLPTATDLFGDLAGAEAPPAAESVLAVDGVAPEPAAEAPAAHNASSATPLFLGDLEVPGFRFDDFISDEDAAGASPAEAKAPEGMGQVMAPLTVRLRPPQAKVAGGAPALVKPMAVLRPTAPLVVPRTQVSPARSLPPVPNIPSPAKPAPVLKVNLPEHLAGDELEVVVLIRQNGTTLAEGHAQRPVPNRGGSVTLNLELKRP